MRSFIHRYWYGPAFALVVAAASLIYSFFGPMPAGFNWAALAVAVLIAGMLVLALFASLARQPNPLSRTYPLYNLKDLPPERRALDSGSADLLLHLLPMAIVAVILLFFAHF